MHNIEAAAKTQDLEEFLKLAFPPNWSGISARILETGAEMVNSNCKWAPRWSKIPATIRVGEKSIDTNLKSVIFRVHDCIHQLWGLSDPGTFSVDDFYNYKRSQMCGEVAVLTLTEFVYCKYLYDTYPELQDVLWSRNALPMLSNQLSHLNVSQIAMRLDGMLHKIVRPRWIREDSYATAFVDDYVPMLQKDRDQIDHNWNVMKESKWHPKDAPTARYGRGLDGLELTVWMIQDFEHMLTTHSEPDRILMNFNRARRANLVLPEGWQS